METTPVTRPAPGLALLLGLSVLRSILLTVGVGAAGVVLAAAGAPFVREWSAFAGNLVVVGVDVATLGVLAWVLRREGSGLPGLLGRFRPRDLGWGVLVAAALLVVLLVGTFVGNLIVYQGPPPAASYDPAFRVPLWFGLWSLLVMPVTVAFAEELLYRGYLQPRWTDRLGAWPGVLAVAVFFALQHIAFALESPQQAIVRVVATFAGGLLLGLLYRRSGRLWPLIVGHWLADVVGLGLFPFLAALAG